MKEYSYNLSTSCKTLDYAYSACMSLIALERDVHQCQGGSNC